jgi:hypothetical protein
MKCYTIARWGVEEGIRVTPDGVILVGEKGRGRELVRAPVPKGAEIIDGRVMAVPAKNQPPGAVLVLIRDHSGFRGTWYLDDPQGVVILIEGWCAQGDAGRAGGGPEYLAVIHAGGSAIIKRTGRLYGKPETLRLRNADGVLTLEDVAAQADTDAARAALEAL